MYKQVHLGKKRSWTTEEDAYLIKLVQKYGPQKWTTISENLPGMHKHTQEGSENSAESDGTIISIQTSARTIGRTRRSGCSSWPINVWETDGLRSPSTFRAGLTIPSRIIGTPPWKKNSLKCTTSNGLVDLGIEGRSCSLRIKTQDTSLKSDIINGNFWRSWPWESRSTTKMRAKITQIRTLKGDQLKRRTKVSLGTKDSYPNARTPSKLKLSIKPKKQRRSARRSRKTSCSKRSSFKRPRGIKKSIPSPISITIASVL